MNAANSMIESESALTSATSSLSAGQTIRQAREAAGLHIAALAVALKVPVKKLEALESDHYDQLLDVVFARALASSVCRHLKLEPEDVLGKLPSAPRQALTEDTSHLNARFPSEGSTLVGMKLPVSKNTLWAVGAVLFAALLLVLWPQVQPYLLHGSTGSDGAGASSSSFDSPAVTSPVMAPVVTAQRQSEPVPVALAVKPVSEPVTQGGGKSLEASDTLKSAPLVNPPVVPLRLLASGASWVEVTDAKGQSVLRKTLQAGESVDLNQGVLPLAVVIGRADLTQAWIKGQTFDLKLVSRDNVARFEVKP